MDIVRHRHIHSHSHRVRELSGTTGSGVSGNTLIRAVQRHAFGRGIGRDNACPPPPQSRIVQKKVNFHCKFNPPPRGVTTTL